MHDRVRIVILIIWNLKFQFCELWKFRIFDIFPVNINIFITISTLMFMKESKSMHEFVERSPATVASITKTLKDWNNVSMQLKNYEIIPSITKNGQTPLNLKKLVKIWNCLNRKQTKDTWLWFTLQININGLSLALNQVLYKRG